MLELILNGRITRAKIDSIIDFCQSLQVQARLKSSPQHTMIAENTSQNSKASWLYHDLNNAFHDVRLMIEGKKRKKTVEELLSELPDNPDEL
ncbi:MAG: hypothetical protein LBR67_00200 [Dysgonamonadaceae bacterium]|jgi:hypothetical protein|nr:hypothetical protein [Dysgonamonadaceae bacterium]